MLACLRLLSICHMSISIEGRGSGTTVYLTINLLSPQSSPLLSHYALILPIQWLYMSAEKPMTTGPRIVGANATLGSLAPSSCASARWLTHARGPTNQIGSWLTPAASEAWVFQVLYV